MIGRQNRQARNRLVASRICITLAAGFLVAAFSVAALAPIGLSLADGLRRLDDGLLQSLHRAMPLPVWQRLMIPVLVRPAWMLPAALGIVCGGLALTVLRPLDGDLRRGGR